MAKTKAKVWLGPGYTIKELVHMKCHPTTLEDQTCCVYSGSKQLGEKLVITQRGETQ